MLRKRWIRFVDWHTKKVLARLPFDSSVAEVKAKAMSLKEQFPSAWVVAVDPK